MAGIGFELKRLFQKNSVISKLRGSSYAAAVTIGPLIMVVVSLLLIYFFLGYNNLLFASRELLANTLLYVFIFSLCTTAPFNAVISRYIADKIYEHEERDILPSFYAGLGANVLLSVLLGAPFSLWLYLVGRVPPHYVLVAYCAYIGLVLVFYSMLYITAMKEYMKIAAAFLLGMALTTALSVVLVKRFGVSVAFGIILSFAAGFLVVGVTLLALIRVFFRENSKNYRGLFRYFKLHWRLLLINTLYTIGLYIHNFIFWTTSLRVVVARSFAAAPVYDMATCIAMFINISTMVIFIVQVETVFHNKYQAYCQTVIGGTGTEIRYAKTEMFGAIRRQLLFMFQLQALITCGLYFLCLLFLPRIGIGPHILDITATLAVAYMIIFLMYCLIIFIYYFNVYSRALGVVALFCAVTFAGTMVIKYLMAFYHFPASLYGLGVLAGAFAGFTYGYFSLKHIEKRLDHYIFCTGSITSAVMDKEWGHTTYNNKKI